MSQRDELRIALYNKINKSCSLPWGFDSDRRVVGASLYVCTSPGDREEIQRREGPVERPSSHQAPPWGSILQRVQNDRPIDDSRPNAGNIKNKLKLRMNEKTSRKDKELEEMEQFFKSNDSH